LSDNALKIVARGDFKEDQRRAHKANNIDRARSANLVVRF